MKRNIAIIAILLVSITSALIGARLQYNALVEYNSVMGYEDMLSTICITLWTALLSFVAPFVFVCMSGVFRRAIARALYAINLILPPKE